MKNRAIEIHDSVLDGLSLQDRNAVLHFSSVYIHESNGTPGVDAGSGLVQEATIKISDAVVEGTFSEWPADLHSGHFAASGKIFDNLIPIPLDFEGKTSLRLQSWNEVISIAGTAAKLELIGEAKYVEEFKP
jgi:hypothetical protein